MELSTVEERIICEMIVKEPARGEVGMPINFVKCARNGPQYSLCAVKIEDVHVVED